MPPRPTGAARPPALLGAMLGLLAQSRPTAISLATRRHAA